MKLLILGLCIANLPVEFPAGASVTPVQFFQTPARTAEQVDEAAQHEAHIEATSLDMGFGCKNPSFGDCWWQVRELAVTVDQQDASCISPDRLVA
ncbi:hypothetical protein WJX82_005205 [Trebouxia sp. C0006]